MKAFLVVAALLSAVVGCGSGRGGDETGSGSTVLPPSSTAPPTSNPPVTDPEPAETTTTVPPQPTSIPENGFLFFSCDGDATLWNLNATTWETETVLAGLPGVCGSIADFILAQPTRDGRFFVSVQNGMKSDGGTAVTVTDVASGASTTVTMGEVIAAATATGSGLDARTYEYTFAGFNPTDSGVIYLRDGDDNDILRDDDQVYEVRVEDLAAGAIVPETPVPFRWCNYSIQWNPSGTRCARWDNHWRVYSADLPMSETPDLSGEGELWISDDALIDNFFHAGSRTVRLSEVTDETSVSDLYQPTGDRTVGPWVNSKLGFEKGMVLVSPTLTGDQIEVYSAPIVNGTYSDPVLVASWPSSQYPPLGAYIVPVGVPQ